MQTTKDVIWWIRIAPCVCCLRKVPKHFVVYLIKWHLNLSDISPIKDISCGLDDYVYMSDVHIILATFFN